MVGFKVVMQINRLGEGVGLAEVVYGHFGKYTADADGECEIEINDFGVGMIMLVPLTIKDPLDGVTVTAMPQLTDQDVLTIEMSTHGRYRDPGTFIPPTP